MGTNPTGLTSNIARQVAQVKANNTNQNNSPVNSGPRTDAFAKATAPTNTAPAVTTAVAAPGSAPAAPVGGTTAPMSPAAAARTAATAPTAPSSVAAAIGMATSSVVFARVSAASAITVGETKDKNKDDTNKAINRATEVADKSSLALKDSNSQTGSEAGEISGANSANAPAA